MRPSKVIGLPLAATALMHALLSAPGKGLRFRAAGPEDAAADLATVAGTVNSVVIVAETAGRLVGYVDARGGRLRRRECLLVNGHLVDELYIAKPLPGPVN